VFTRIAIDATPFAQKAGTLPTKGKTMTTTLSKSLNLRVRWGIAAAITFGSIGWIVGSTIPGPLHGTSFVATVVWSLCMGTIAWIPGDLLGRTVDELHRREQRLPS
jgi:hypothetical protein